MKRGMKHGWFAALVAGIVFAASQSPARAQEMGPGGGIAGMQRVMGEVTAVNGDTVTVKTEDGTIAKVVTTANTRMFKQGGTAFKVSDLKVGDGLMAGGNMDAPNKTLHALFLGATDAEQVRKLRENLGKTYISGRITAIDADNAKITVLRTDGVSQTIGLDETTSFRRGRGGRGGAGGGMMVLNGGGNANNASAAIAANSESITLADVKVGDQVTGQGSLKGGVFIPAQLFVATPGQRRRNPDAAAPAPDAKPQP